ncbi:hypothetical protein Bca52824_019357 [Brassica carinata]|uniref:Uncharacterized protein n=1 Tax=Brassica carinata TaxID=52824 RepID=A0A8X7VRW9_BRACI|nr:hypothetical protein Bca52824_019357 [Brassica carinata]
MTKAVRVSTIAVVVTKEIMVVNVRVYTTMLGMVTRLSLVESDGGGGHGSGYGEAVVEDVRVDIMVVDIVEMENMRKAKEVSGYSGGGDG